MLGTIENAARAKWLIVLFSMSALNMLQERNWMFCLTVAQGLCFDTVPLVDNDT